MEFLADEHRAAEANIRASDFEGQIYSAYEQLFNVWLQSKEAAKEARVSWLIFPISAPTDIHVLFFSSITSSPFPSSSPSLSH